MIGVPDSHTMALTKPCDGAPPWLKVPIASSGRSLNGRLPLPKPMVWNGCAVSGARLAMAYVATNSSERPAPYAAGSGNTSLPATDTVPPATVTLPPADHSSRRPTRREHRPGELRCDGRWQGELPAGDIAEIAAAGAGKICSTAVRNADRECRVRRNARRATARQVRLRRRLTMLPLSRRTAERIADPHRALERQGFSPGGRLRSHTRCP